MGGLPTSQARLYQKLPPRWESLHGLGEMRLLRVSYFILAAVALWAIVVSCWNATVVERVNAQVRSKHAYAVNQVGIALGELNDAGASEWTKLWAQHFPLHEAAPPAAPNVVPEAVENLSRLLRGALDRHPGLEAKLVAFRETGGFRPAKLLLDHLSIGWRLRLLYAAMVSIAFANVLYSVFCPSTLRVVHRPHRQGAPTGLGDRFDWCVSLFNLVFRSRPDDKERRILVDKLVRWDARTTRHLIEGASPATHVISAWNNLQYHWPLCRLLCLVLYVAGLLCTAGILVERAVSLWTG